MQSLSEVHNTLMVFDCGRNPSVDSVSVDIGSQCLLRGLMLANKCVTQKQHKPFKISFLGVFHNTLILLTVVNSFCINNHILVCSGLVLHNIHKETNINK